MKLCPGTVVPVIFASSLMAIPTLVASLMGKDFWIANMLNSSMWFDPEHISYSGGANIKNNATPAQMIVTSITQYHLKDKSNPLCPKPYANPKASAKKWRSRAANF